MHSYIEMLHSIVVGRVVCGSSIDSIRNGMASYMGPKRCAELWGSVSVDPLDVPSIEQISGVMIHLSCPRVEKVSLTEEEMEFGACVGIRRHMQDIREGLTPRFGDKELMALDNIVGAWGEQAVAKWAGYDWNGSLGDFAASDAGPHQVRTSRRDNGLNVYNWDGPKSNRWFVAVRGVAPNLKILGCMLGSEAMQERFRLNAGAFFVPARLLHPLFWLPA